jgi:hypothetical protein
VPSDEILLKADAALAVFTALSDKLDGFAVDPYFW